jgi:hypothetical protein
VYVHVVNVEFALSSRLAFGIVLPTVRPDTIAHGFGNDATVCSCIGVSDGLGVPDGLGGSVLRPGAVPPDGDVRGDAASFPCTGISTNTTAAAPQNATTATSSTSNRGRRFGDGGSGAE